jgi:hypothetical protein
MIKNLETQKLKTQEALLRAADEYYEEFSRRTNGEKFTIDTIEEMMLSQQRKMREILNDANSELVSGIEIENKKNALSAEE